MPNPHYRITVTHRGAKSPRHYDYATHERAAFKAEIAALAAVIADDHNSALSVTLTNFAKADAEPEDPPRRRRQRSLLRRIGALALVGFFLS